ncbi:MAG TPA: preprotein translocase subunit SecG [Myxococcales bacterium]|nr:preprotein translocase subunit SecG [Myxococcales bacterium]
MGTVLIILHVVVCTFLILIVLLQAGKGGGLNGTFGSNGSGSVFGGRGASTFLSKTTALMAGLFMLFSVLLTLVNFSDDLEAAARDRAAAQQAVDFDKTDADKTDADKKADADKAADKKVDADKAADKKVDADKAADKKVDAKKADVKKAADKAVPTPSEGSTEKLPTPTK